MINPERPHGLMFHHFYNQDHPRGQGAISADQLAQVIEFYGRERILLPGEWVQKAHTRCLNPDDVCLTFDDNLLCQYEIALPVLEQYNLTAFWFVYSSVLTPGVKDAGKIEIYRKFRTVCFESVEEFYAEFFKTAEGFPFRNEIDYALTKFLPDDYLREFVFYTDEDKRFRFVRDGVLGLQRYEIVMDRMLENYNIDISSFTLNLWMEESHLQDLHSRGHIVGLHSHSHPTSMAQLLYDQQKTEYQSNYNALRRILGEAPQVMSHPNNSYNDGTLEILKNMGILLGFRSNMAPGFVSRLEFPRQDHANIVTNLVR